MDFTVSSKPLESKKAESIKLYEAEIENNEKNPYNNSESSMIS